MRKTYKTSTTIIPKLPAYGKTLADRWRFNNPPKLIIICSGGDCWNRAKRWQSHTNFAALVLTPEQNPKNLKWQVGGCICLVEWGIGPGAGLIIELVQVLLGSGAVSVTVMPLFVDHKKPAILYDLNRPYGQRFIQVRESLRTYARG